MSEPRESKLITSAFEPEYEDLRSVMSQEEFGKLLRIENDIRWLGTWRHPYTQRVEFPELNGSSKYSLIHYTQATNCNQVVTAIHSTLKKSLVRIMSMHGCSVIADYVPAEALEKWKWAYVITETNMLACDVIYKDGEDGGRIDFQVYIILR